MEVIQNWFYTHSRSKLAGAIGRDDTIHIHQLGTGKHCTAMSCDSAGQGLYAKRKPSQAFSFNKACTESRNIQQPVGRI